MDETNNIPLTLSECVKAGIQSGVRRFIEPWQLLLNLCGRVFKR